MKLFYFATALLSIITMVCMYIIILLKKHIKLIESMGTRYNIYYKMLNQWLKNKAQNKMVINYLMKNGINTVAIYGIGEVGQRLYEELKEEQAKVSYFIDSAGGNTLEGAYGIEVISTKEISLQEKVDAIIVTPIYDFEHIYDSLVNENIDSIILSLEDIIFEQK